MGIPLSHLGKTFVYIRLPDRRWDAASRKTNSLEFWPKSLIITLPVKPKSKRKYYRLKPVACDQCVRRVDVFSRVSLSFADRGARENGFWMNPCAPAFSIS